MKNVIIINAYPNTTEKEGMLFDCISQFKKTGHDILLSTNYPSISERVLKLCNLVVYTDDNVLIPAKDSASCWFADYEDFIEIFTPGIGYIVVKKLKLAVDLAHTMKYDNFIFMEYDSIISDTDLPKIEDWFTMTEKKKAVFFHFSSDLYPIDPEYNPLGYETLMFAGNVSFFANDIQFPETYDEWLGNPMWATGHKVLEYKFKTLFDAHPNDVEVLMNHKSTTFFPTSKIDISHQAKDVHIIQNIDNPLNPLLLVLGDTDINVLVKINGQIVYDGVLPKAVWRSVYFDLSTEVYVEITARGRTDTYNITPENIASHSTGVRTNLRGLTSQSYMWERFSGLSTGM